ncbi:hypothetical protein N136_04832, partial [Leifsonia aquatica ATCC 14665]
VVVVREVLVGAMFVGPMIVLGVTVAGLPVPAVASPRTPGAAGTPRVWTAAAEGSVTPRPGRPAARLIATYRHQRALDQRHHVR